MVNGGNTLAIGRIVKGGTYTPSSLTIATGATVNDDDNHATRVNFVGTGNVSDGHADRNKHKRSVALV